MPAAKALIFIPDNVSAFPRFACFVRDLGSIHSTVHKTELSVRWRGLKLKTAGSESTQVYAVTVPGPAVRGCKVSVDSAPSSKRVKQMPSG